MASGQVTILTVEYESTGLTYSVYADEGGGPFETLIESGVAVGDPYTFTVSPSMVAIAIADLEPGGGKMGFDGILWEPSGGSTVHYSENGPDDEPIPGGSPFDYYGAATAYWNFGVYGGSWPGAVDDVVDAMGSGVGNVLTFPTSMLADSPDPPDDGDPTPDPDPDPPVEPGGAILEIYVGDPDGARWDVAEWDEDVWSASAWVDITPEGITVRIRWGANRPELGILAESEAATWAVDTYDPARILDPSNADSPYYGELVPTLPIRLRHDSTVVRQGTVESLGYTFKDKGGYIRATDNLSAMANARIGPTLEVADTLRARARDVIAAAGLTIEVEPDPVDGDPALPARVPGEATVWDVIEDAAQGVLHLPWIDATNRLRFRAYANPLYRGRAITAAELVDLLTIVDMNGLFSRVIVQPEDPEDDPIVRAVTPTPKYGAKTYTRDEPTLDPEGWASAVLADRAVSGRRWIPGQVYATTADTVHMFATMEAVELVALLHSYTAPAVDVGALVLGGEIEVVGKKDSAAVWTFQLYTAEAPPVALVDSATGSIFMVASDGADTPGALLYPSGEGALGGGGGAGGTGEPPITPPVGGGGDPPPDPPTGVVYTIVPADGASALVAAIRSGLYDIVELSAGVYGGSTWQNFDIYGDLSGRPVTLVPPLDGVGVARFVGPATSTGIIMRLGDTDTLTDFTIDDPDGRIVFDGIELAQSGIIEPRDCRRVDLIGMRWRDLSRNSAPGNGAHKSYAIYASGAGSGSTGVLDDFRIIGPRFEAPASNREVSAMQIASSGSHGHIEITGVVELTGYHYALSVDRDVDELILDDWTMDDSGRVSNGSSIRILTGAHVDGTYSNIHATDSEPFVNAGTGTMVDGGGNTGI